MNKLGKKVKDTGKEAKNAQPHMKGLNKGFRKGSAGASKMKRAVIGLVAAIGTFLIIRKAIGTLKSFIKQGVDTENQLLVLESITGDAKLAMEAFDWAVRKAAETPFEISEIIESFTSLKAYGFDAMNTLDLVGNMALSMGRSIEDATRSLALSAQGTNKSLRSLFAVSTPQVAKWTEGLEKGTVAYKKALVAGMKTVTRFQGGMERAQGTTSVIMSNIEDWWSRMKMQLAGKPGAGLLADAWKGLLRNILDRLEGMEEKAASIMRGLGKVLGRVISMVSQVVNKALNWMERWVNKTGAAFEDQKRGIYPFILWLTLAFGKVKGFFEDFKRGWDEGASGIRVVSELLDKLFMKDMEAPGSGGWGSFAEALGNVAAGFKAITVAFDMLKKSIEGWEWIFTMTGRGMDWIALGARAAGGDPYAQQEWSGSQQNREKMAQTATVRSPEEMRAEWAVKYGTGEGNKSLTYGDIHIKIEPQPGQSIDPAALSKEIIKQMEEQSVLEIERGGGVGGT